MNTKVYINQTKNDIQLVTEDGLVIDNLIVKSFQQYRDDHWGLITTSMEIQLTEDLKLWPPDMKTVVKSIRKRESYKQTKGENPKET
jgi:hypothetical protein